MLSALSPFDPLFNSPFLAFDNGCFTPRHDPSPSPSLSPSLSPGPSPELVSQFEPARPGLSRTPAKRVAAVTEERKRRRMISNRESARRSRMRKQKHLENLRFQVNRFRIQNRELNNKLRFLVHHCNRVRTENDWLRSEQTRLRQRLYNITQILVLQPFSASAWACNNTIFT